jgi:hypothetical protein
MDVFISDNVSSSMIEETYSDKYILSCIEYDSSTPSYINHPLAKYYSAWNNKEFLGLILCVRYNKFEIEMHSLLKKESIPHSREIGKLIIEEMFNNEDVLRITAPVQGNLKSTMNFLEKIGFVKEGIKKDAIIKKAIVTDMYIYGITKKHWKEYK